MKNKDEYDKMELYARRIQECQHDLGLEISSFDNIGMSATSFLWEFIRKEDNNEGNQEEQNYQMKSNTKVTLIMNKRDSLICIANIFEDDENKADR